MTHIHVIAYVLAAVIYLSAGFVFAALTDFSVARRWNNNGLTGEIMWLIIFLPIAAVPVLLWEWMQWRRATKSNQ